MLAATAPLGLRPKRPWRQDQLYRLLDVLLDKEDASIVAAKNALNTIEALKQTTLAKAMRGELGTNVPAEADAWDLLREVLRDS